MSRRVKNNNAQKGFTLLEVLLATFILSIGVLAMAKVQIVSLRVSRDSATITSAIFLAEAKIEELKKAGFAHLVDGNFPLGPNTPIDATGAEGGIFMRTWKITHYANSIHMKKVEVTVRWPEKNPDTKIHEISFGTVLSKHF